MPHMFPIPAEIKQEYEDVLREFRDYQAAGHQVVFHIDPFDPMKDPASNAPATYEFEPTRQEWFNADPGGETDPSLVIRVPNTFTSIHARVRPILEEEKEDASGGVLDKGLFEIELPVEEKPNIENAKWVEIKFLDSLSNVVDQIDCIIRGFPTTRGLVEANRVSIICERTGGRR